MGRKAKKRREQKNKLIEENKIHLQEIRRSRYLFPNFWKRWEFFAVTASLIALIIYPIYMNYQNKKITEKKDETVLHTSMGDITIEFFGDEAPKTVENFIELSNNGFYNGLIFHRVIKEFMIQGGCPNGDGTGGPGYEFEDEINDRKIVAGTLAMANSGPDTNGSQFFIVTEKEQPHLNGQHTVFGQVSEGMEVVSAIANSPVDKDDKPITAVIIISVEIK